MIFDLLRSCFVWLGKDCTESLPSGAVLVIAPHPDDETLGCGATIARLKKAGRKVRTVIVTDGGASEAGKRVGYDHLTNIRHMEAIHAADALGIGSDDVVFLNYADGDASNYVDAIAKDIAAQVADYAPSLIFSSCHLDHHPDHRAIATAVGQLQDADIIQCPVFQYAIWYRLQEWPHGLLRCLTTLSLYCRSRAIRCGEFLVAKKAAIEQYQSQFPTQNGEHISRFCQRYIQPNELFYERFKTPTVATYNFEPAHSDMAHHLKSGILNSGALQIIQVLCQLASVIFLSRLLPPSEFGIIAMVSPIYGFVILFQDMGLTQASIQRPTLSHDEVNTFFWINIVVGLVLTILVVALSPLIGWYYHEPRVVPLTMAMGLMILLGSLGNQPCAILTRRMHFGVLSLTGVVGAVSGLVTSIIGALVLKNFWALYWGMLAGTVLPIIGVWIAAKWRPSLPIRIAGMGKTLKFGVGMTSASLSSFITRNVDNVLIGHRWGDYSLGLYDRAYKLLLFPLQRMVGPVINTMVPILSRLSDEPDRYRSIFLNTMGQIILIAWPGVICAIVLSHTLVPTLLGQQWLDSARLFQPLACAGFLQIANGFARPLFVSQGRSGDLARWGMMDAITCVLAFVIGLPYGAFGVATAYAISELLRTPFLWRYTTRSGAVKLSNIIDTLLPLMVGAGATYIAVTLYNQMVQLSPIPLLTLGGALSYIVMVATLSLSSRGRAILQQSLSALQRVINRAKPQTRS